MITRAVEYTQAGVALEDYLAFDDAIPGPRPGVLVAHEWWGLEEFTRNRARALASLGFVAFALDMFGAGVRTDDPAEAGKLAGPFFADKAAMRDRAAAGLAVLQSQPDVDKGKLAAIGYCFGGAVAFELAYSGAPLAGAVSFHGSLPVLKAEDAPRVRARLLAMHGADDPMVKPDAVAAFQKGIAEGKVDCQLVCYSGAVHAFTNPGADARGIPGIAYDARAAARSWSQLTAFFAEVFSG